MTDTSVHMAHCDIGEYEGSCKYGEDETCPALPKERTVTDLVESVLKAIHDVKTFDGDPLSHELTRDELIDIANAAIAAAKPLLRSKIEAEIREDEREQIALLLEQRAKEFHHGEKVFGYQHATNLASAIRNRETKHG